MTSETKNTIIGFTLIGVIMFGFTWYQSRQYQKQMEYQAQLDSIAQAERLEAYALDSLNRIASGDTLDNAATTVVLSTKPTLKPYRDDNLTKAREAEASVLTLSNDKMEIAFTTKGAQPYSVKLLDYVKYDSSSLYLIPPQASEFNVNVFAGESVDTKEFVFDVAEVSDSSIVMRLPFAQGGYIQQKYVLSQGSYMVHNELSFVGMDSVIPSRVSSVDLNWKTVVPRLEKGYKNEKQYSKIDYYVPGEKSPEDMGNGKNESKRLDAKFDWVAFQQQFFSSILTAPEGFESGEFGVEYFPEDDVDRNLMTCSAHARAGVDMMKAGDKVIPFDFYFGPNHYHTLKSYDRKYEKIIPLGGWLVGWISRFIIIPCFDLLGRFISNYGLIILIMTVLLKIVISPLTIKSYMSSAKMSALKPEMDKINEKYPKQEDAMKKQQATMELYQRAGVKPLGGCLPMLLQFPILWAMFRFFPASIELRQKSFLWADDLSAYDSIWDFGVNIPLFGDHLSLFALLMAVSMFLYSKMTSSQMSNDPQMASMKFMSVWLMPIMMLFICNNLSSGLSYYYFISNLLTMLQTFIIKKWVVKPEKILAQVQASKGKPLPKSKWQQRLEEAQKMQQAQLKAQQKQRK
ncbi:MAG: membrane protein insertase YidC [Candidatus Cryptobacteroides sp.]|nr:membrane protein insertase YidC [Bacteroidales bacterium]MDY2774231.1 membrane protein insertase YidC [Candidatus Cryptobacteroides sp.]